MGFIERLSRENEERRRKLEEKGRLKREREVEHYRAEEKKDENRQRCLTASDFASLTQKLALTIGAKRYDLPDHISLFWDEYSLFLLDGNDYHRGKYIEIRAMDDWSIKVIGGFFGSTTLKKSDWFENRDIQEKALEKAYNHPVRYRSANSTPTERPSG